MTDGSELDSETRQDKVHKKVAKNYKNLELGSRQKKEIKSIVSAVLSVIPGVGDAKDVQEAITGKDHITNEKLSNKQRIITVIAAAVPLAGGKVVRELVEGTADAASCVSKASKAAKITNKTSSVQLGKNLIAAGFKRKANQAAHHIVAQTAKIAESARRIMKKYKIGIDDADNGVFLDTKIHSRIHTKDYYTTLNKRLSNAGTKSEVMDVLKLTTTELKKGKYIKKK